MVDKWVVAMQEQRENAKLKARIEELEAEKEGLKAAIAIVTKPQEYSLWVDTEMREKPVTTEEPQ